MPGVYAKQMSGRRFDEMCGIVEKGKEYLKEKNYVDLLNETVSSLLMITSERSRKVIEEFYYAEGFVLIFQIMKAADSSLDYICCLRHILQFFKFLLAIEVDAYDDNVGSIPILTFFLTERHTYNVDIYWKSDELLLAAEFIDAYLHVLCNYKVLSLNQDDVQLLITTMNDVFLTFPPHRVVGRAVNVLNDPKRCTSLISTLSELVSSDENTIDTVQMAQFRLEAVQLLYGISAFGLGDVLASDLPQSQLILILFSQLISELRCSCGRCEHIRKLQKAARDRDEFGINPESKQKLASMLVQSGAIQFMSSILEKINLSRKSQRLNFKMFDTSSTTDNLDDMCTTASEGDDSEELNNLSFAHLTKEMRIDDKTKQIIIRSVWLLSWPAQEFYQCSILSANESSLAIQLLKSVNLSDIRLWFNPSTMEMLKSVQESIECLCGLLLRTRESEFEQLYSRMKPTLLAIIESTCSVIPDVCSKQSLGKCDDWNNNVSRFALTQSAILTTIYIAESLLKKSQKKSNTRRRQQHTIIPPIPIDCYEKCVTACRVEYETYERLMSISNDQLFISTLLLCMGLLAGGFEYTQSLEGMRSLLLPPPASCAFMASAARFLLSKYEAALPSNEIKCIMVLSVASVAIARSEKAAALMLPTKTS